MLFSAFVSLKLLGSSKYIWPIRGEIVVLNQLEWIAFAVVKEHQPCSGTSLHGRIRQKRRAGSSQAIDRLLDVGDDESEVANTFVGQDRRRNVRFRSARIGLDQ